MGGQGRAGDHSGCACAGQVAQAHHADHRPDAALRPRVRQDLQALLREPAGLRRRLRPRLVQADPPRHGPEGSLPGSRGAEGRPDLAGPAARGHPQADGRRYRRPEGKDRRIGSLGRRAGVGGLGLGLHLPRRATSAAAPTARAWPWPRRRTGKSTRSPSRRCPSWWRSRRPPTRPRWPT